MHPKKQHIARRSALAGGLLAGLFLPTTAIQALTFQGLGGIPGAPGAFSAYSVARGISADGSVVVGYGITIGQEAARWTSATGMVGLGDLPGSGFLSSASSASADGSVVAGFGSSAASAVDDEREAFRWTAATGMVGLGDLAGGAFSSRANGISADGSVVIGYGSSASGSEAFRWTADAGMAGLGDLPGGSIFSRAEGISADGSVVVGEGTSASGSEAFRWTAATGMVGLGDLSGGGFQSFARAASSDGSVIVGGGLGATGLQAFRWTAAGGMVNLGDLPGGFVNAYATGVSADGSIVVGVDISSNNAAGDEPFVWDATNGMRSFASALTTSGINLAGWNFDGSISISGDGTTLAGTGTHNGVSEAWLVTGFVAVPEPSTWALLLGGGVWTFLIHRKRRQAG
jgi:probable HAF family extracellular repeat protein